MRWALDRTGGNKTAAAKLLGISRETITNWTRVNRAAGGATLTAAHRRQSGRKI